MKTDMKTCTATAATTATKNMRSKSTSESWTEVVKKKKNRPVKPTVFTSWSPSKSTQLIRPVVKSRTEPAFTSANTRVVVQVKHFNNKKFNGFITLYDAKLQIFQAIGLELSNHHRTSFERAEEDNSILFITFKFKNCFSKDQLSRFFWYFKESSAGVDDMISG
jgi:hypothetical protein